MKFPALFPVAFVTIASTLMQMKGSSAFLLSGAPQERSSYRSAQSVCDPRFSDPRSLLALQASAQENTNDDDPTEGLPSRERKVYEFLKELNDSELSFRIVVVGNGAILESTNPLGPTFKLSVSKKTGNSIVTFAAEDQSFEFHLMPAQIASAALVEKPSPTKEGKTMRLLRFLNADGGSICSLILADDSDSGEAQTWYQSMATKHGSEIEF